MHQALVELQQVVKACEEIEAQFELPPVVSARERLMKACDQVGQAWSRSWIGYQANVYTARLQPARPGEHFDSEWGRLPLRVANQTTGAWSEYDHETIRDAILKRAGKVDLDRTKQMAALASRKFDDARDEFVTTLDALLAAIKDRTLSDARDEARKLASHISASKFIDAVRPSQFMTRDWIASAGGFQTPPHVVFQMQLAEIFSHGEQAKKLGKLV